MTDIIALALAAASGLTVGILSMAHVAARYRNAMKAFELLANEWREECAASSTSLNALRRNCFITNEKGHRVRYFDASPERQAKAKQ